LLPFIGRARQDIPSWMFPDWRQPLLFLFRGFFRFVFAMSRNCFSDIDLTICFEAPLRLDFALFVWLRALRPQPFAVFRFRWYFLIVTR
jgi:hypothetical protein